MYIYIYIYIYNDHDTWSIGCYIYIYIHIISTYPRHTQSAQISQKQDGRNTYTIMKTIYPPGYHHNGFVVIMAFRSHWLLFLIHNIGIKSQLRKI